MELENKIYFENKKGELVETTVSDQCTVTIKIQDGTVVYCDENNKKKMTKSTGITSFQVV